MKKNSNFLIVISSILLVFIFSISVINSNNTTETSASSVSEKRIGWGIKRSKNNEQADLGSVNRKIIDTYEGIAMGNKNSKYVYLTFDNGYEAGYTNSILDTLKSHNVKAAFFIVGNVFDSNPDLIRRMNDEGHIVANHTLTHPNMSKMSTFEDFKAQIIPIIEKTTDEPKTKNKSCKKVLPTPWFEKPRTYPIINGIIAIEQGESDATTPPKKDIKSNIGLLAPFENKLT